MLLSSVNHLFDTHVKRLVGELSRLSSTIPSTQSPAKDEFYADLVAAFQLALEGCRNVESQIGHDLDLLQATQQRFRGETAKWLEQSWLGERCRTRPRGYPGDFELLTKIYDEQPASRGLGGYIDLYIINLLLAKSIRSRWQHMRRFLINELSSREGDVSILNVASGLCREYREPFQLPDGPGVHLQCLDNDPEALNFVRGHVVPGSDIKDFNLSRYNAMRLKSSSATIRKFGRFDIVYSIGLVDYIPDAMLIEILRGLRECVNEQGVVYINFKDKERYDHTPYQWLLDWHFLLRDESDCRRLFRSAGYDVAHMEMTRDDTGVIMNFVSRIATRQIRIDAPSTPLAARVKSQFTAQSPNDTTDI